MTGLAPRLDAATAGFPLLIVAAAILAATVWLYPGLEPFFDIRLLQRLGRISFSLYLVHEPILVIFAPFFVRDTLWLTAVVGIPVAFAVAQLFFVFVEQPSQRLARSVSGAVRRDRYEALLQLTDEFNAAFQCEPPRLRSAASVTAAASTIGIAISAVPTNASMSRVCRVLPDGLGRAALE